MGLSFSVSDGMIRVSAEGQFNLEDIHATFSEIRVAHSAASPLRILVEDSGSDFEPNTPGVKAMVAGWARVFEGVSVRIALLVRRDLHFGLGRQATVFAEQSQLKFDVFRERSEALAWLAGLETSD